MLQTYPGFVDNTLDQEGNWIPCSSYGFHSLLVTRVPQVDTVNLMRQSKNSNIYFVNKTWKTTKSCSCLRCSFTSTILSPVFRVPFCPAGLSSRMCLIKMPLITSPLLRRLPIPRPPTMLIPRDLPGSLKSSTLRKRTNLSFIRFYFLLLQMIISKRQRRCC